MAGKSFNNLPVVLQTTAIKNFFENTVDQLYSKADTEVLKGYIGKQYGNEVNLSGAFITTDNIDKTAYALSPAVNNINPVTGESENIIFYDELCNTLRAYGVNTRNHNALFSSSFNTFLPPINIDKFLNYAEYYWAIPGSIETLDTYVFPADANRAGGLSRSQTYSIDDPATNGTGAGCKISVFVDDSDGSGYVQIVSKGNNYDIDEIITITDSQIGGFGGADITFNVKEVLGPTALTITPDSQGPLNLDKDVRGKKEFTPVNGKPFRNGMIVKFTGIFVTPALEEGKEFVVSGVGSSIRLTEKDTTSDADQDTKDYIVIERGSVTGTQWSRVNHWYHIDNFKEAGDNLPAKKYRANRPIVEFISDLELYFDSVTEQSKTKENQEPLFNLYDDKGNSLADQGLYANSNFSGSKVFNYQQGSGAKDPELGFALSFSQTKSASEIAFENFISTERFNYTPFGSVSSIDILGTYYYKITGDAPEYYSSWRASPKKSQQKILTSYKISSNDVIEKLSIFDIGAIPDVNAGSPSGYNILVRHNDTIVSNYEYKDSTINFTSFGFNTGDIIEIEVVSEDGLRLINNSRYDLPLSWANNPENNEVEIVAEAQYLPHFKRLIENQNGFSGDALGRNNFDNSEKDISHAVNIVQTDEDLTLGSFLVDDQPHNLVEAIRFVGKEYQKYKNRLVKEITDYTNRFDTSGLSNEVILEKVLRNLQSFNIGKDVFGTTYILPYGDTYTEESFDVTDATDVEYTLSAWGDISKLENTVLVYLDGLNNSTPKLLELDSDYTFSDTNPITIKLSSNIVLNVGDTIITKLYNNERDSANCPPTPSAMGIYPLHQPHIETDNTFTTPVDVVIGHDGSRTISSGILQDALLLEFETRIYNSCQKQFRDATGFTNFNVVNVRPGAFRDTGFESKEFSDLLRNSFTNWANRNKVDALSNEYYNELDKWTWNYRGNIDLPGYWRGWYEYYYDTVRPNTHPWEMLGFFEEPTWWSTLYGTDYSSANTTMWADLEQGIIRQGSRQTHAQNSQNLFARPNLVNNFLPVDKYGNLRAPAEITSTGSTSIGVVWNNRRSHNLVITDQFYDETGSSNLPNGVTATAGTGISFRIAYDADGWDVYSKGYDSFLTSNVYVTNSNIDKSFQFTNYSFDQLGNSQIIFDQSITSVDGTYTPTGNTFIGVSVTGTPITTPKSSASFNDEQEWHENKYYRREEEETGTYTIQPEHAGISQWNTSEHSSIVGWTFDNVPVYGPYGYSNPLDITSDIVAVKSSYELKAGTRPSGPGGAYTGEYVEDYTWNSALSGQNGYADRFNMRYGFTPESPTQPIYYYVATYYNNAPQFPFVIGGVVDGASDVTWAGKYYSAVTEPEKNNAGIIDATGQIVVLQSVGTLDTGDGSTIDLTANDWRFGDGAPAENAWKYSSDYAFAVVEGLLLSKPGKFATVFADPTNVESPKYEPYKVINKTDRNIWNYRDNKHFRIHGDVDSNGEAITNSGYTQFIHSWLTFQGLNTTSDFADKLRKVNVKLAHRLEGFSDKDTMILRSDQFSSTGTSQSLVIPEENFKLAVHSSPYKERNFYSGVMIQKVPSGYKVRGYDKNLGYFNTLKLNKFGDTSEFEVGGEAVAFTDWEPNLAYSKGTIVAYQNRYYRAENFVTSSQTFVNTLWQPLSSLPQVGAVKGVVYQDTLPEVVRVDYETKFKTHQDVLDFLIALGKYQELQGYDFGGFDTAINDARNWSYAGQQFLFWVAGGWENNNTLELSPMANKISFELENYFVAKINRIERNQFSLIDQDGKVIQPEECEIVRQGNRIEITPPSETQLYGCLLYTKQTEHALIIDNKTEFNDTIHDQLFNQRQTRLRIKGKKTANWNGTFSSEGFIISGDELKPNLDNMAQSLGRYHELGFIPVEKQLYEKARGLFGYEEKEYLNNLEVDDDTQFEFYSGMIHEKGTIPALSKIAKSNNIVQGEMTVYDEWALKVGEFGDLENDQAIELKIEKSDLVSSPQMVTLAFPEDTTGVIKHITVVEPKHKYHEKPSVNIAKPSVEPKVQATAEAHLNSDGNISGIQVTNIGSGYPTENVKLNILVADLLVNDYKSDIKPAIVQSSDLITISRITPEPQLGFLNLSTFKIVEKQTGSDVNINIDVSDSTLTLSKIAEYINSNSNVSAEYIESENSFDQTTYVTSGILSLTGAHFELVENNNTLSSLNLSAGTYEVKQRYSVGSVDNIKGKSSGATTINDINVLVNDTELTRVTDYVYDHGSRTSINFNINSFVIAESQRVDSSGKLFLDTVFTGNVDLVNTVDITTKNLYNIAGVYPYVDLYIDGDLINNVPSRQVYSVSATGIELLDVSMLPNGSLKNGANVYVHEHSTVELNDSVSSDIPGADLVIKVSTNDNIIALGEVQRIYSITPDSKNDDTILIDIDDSDRFLKKPIGTKEKGIWPTTSNISYSGVTDERFKNIPNSGYVTKYDVDFRSFSVNDITLLFRNDNFYHPDDNHTIHVASAEGDDWNVYKLKNIKDNNANAVSYVEQGTNTLNLLSDIDLFKYTDTNKILETDTGRFLDYHLVIKDTEQNEKFVVWTNQEVLDFQQVILSNLKEVTPLEVGIELIKPTEGSYYAISNISPAVGHWASAEVFGAGNGVVKINTPINSGLEVGDSVILTTVFPGTTSGTVAQDNTGLILEQGANLTSWSGNVFTVGSVGLDSFTVKFNTTDYFNFTNSSYGTKTQTGYLNANEATVRYLNHVKFTTTTDHGLSAGKLIRLDVPGYGGDYIIRSAGPNTITINTPFVANGPTSGGNVLTQNLTIITTENHGLGGYKGKLAISNNSQQYYNKSYDMKHAFGNIIQVTDTFPVTSDTWYDPLGFSLLSTIDHDMIYPNGNKIKLDNTQSADGIVESFNRRQAIMRGALTYKGSLGLGFNILRRSATNGPKNTIGATPYVTDFTNIDLNGLRAAGQLAINKAVATTKGFVADKSIRAQSRMTSSKEAPLRNRKATQVKAVAQSTATSYGLPNIFNPKTLDALKDKYHSSGSLNKYSGTSTPTGTSIRNRTSVRRPDRDRVGIADKFLSTLPTAIKAAEIDKNTTKVVPIVTKSSKNSSKNPGGRIGQTLTLLQNMQSVVQNSLTVSPGNNYKESDAGDFTFGGGGMIEEDNTNTNTGGGTNTNSGGGNADPATPVVDPAVLDSLDTQCTFEVGGNYPTLPPPPPENPPPDDPEPPVDPVVDCKITFAKDKVEEGSSIKVFIQAVGLNAGDKVYVTFERVKDNETFKETSYNVNDSYALQPDLVEIRDTSTGTNLWTSTTGGDFSIKSPLELTVDSNERAGPLLVTTKADKTYDGENLALFQQAVPADETMVARLWKLNAPGGANSTIDPTTNGNYCNGTTAKILDTSIPDAPPPPPEPGYSIRIGQDVVNEGAAFLININATEVPANTPLYVTLEKSNSLSPSETTYDPMDTYEIEDDLVSIQDQATGHILRNESNISGLNVNNSGVSNSNPLQVKTDGNGKAGPLYVVTKNDNINDGGSTPANEILVARLWSSPPVPGINTIPLAGTGYEDLDTITITDSGVTPTGGTVLSSSCTGTTLVEEIADGSGGSTTRETLNSPTCGYTEPATCTPISKWIRHFTSESTQDANTGNSGDNTDIWVFDLSDAGGDGELIYYNDSGADQIRIYQADSKNTISNQNLIAKISNSVTASAENKNNLAKSNTGAGWANFLLTNIGVQNRPFNDAIDPNDKTGARWAGKMPFTIKCPKEGGGAKIVVTVNKTSSVYQFYIDVPHASGKAKSELNQSYGNTGANDPGTGGGSGPGRGGTKWNQTPYYRPVGNYNAGGQASRWSDPYDVQNNFSGFNAYSMTGHRSLPSIFRKPARKSTNVLNYGKYDSITNEKFVTVTEQRISGGAVLPLATPVPKPQKIRPRAISGSTVNPFILDDFFSTSFDTRFDTRTNGFIDFTDGYTIRDSKNKTDGYPDPDPITIPDDAWTLGAGVPVQAENSFEGERVLVEEAVFNPTTQPLDGYPGVSVDDPNAPADVEVEYTTQPIITILPKKEVRPGTLLPDGLVAFVPLYKPTPSVKIPATDIVGVNPGDEIVINGTPVTIPGGGFSGFLNAMQCSNISGVNISGKVAGSGIPYVKVSSCSNAPLTFRNGCASGGKYKEIMDFHVVRSFTDTTGTDKGRTTTQVPGYAQTSSKTQKVPNVSNPLYDPRENIPNINYDPVATLPNPSYDPEVVGSSPTIPNPTYNNSPTMSNPNYNVDGGGFINVDGSTTSSGYSEVTIQESTNVPGTTQSSETTTLDATAVTGGSGYVIGDRLRLIGGTPVPTPYGGIYELCVKNGGANYSSSANVRIYIGDGNSPGSGAKVDYVELNQQTKGIEKVYIRTAGVGYDIKNPPKVTVIDTYGIGATNSARVVPAVITAQVDKSSYHVPRVAKFEVTSTDERGAIHGIKILDRGVYEQLPSDLDKGLPLEYDYVLLGDEDDGEWIRNVDADGDGEVREGPTGTGLGQWDPTNNFARLPTPVGPGGDGFDPNPGRTIGINELSPYNSGVAGTQKIDYATAFPYLQVSANTFSSNITDKGVILKNWAQRDVSARDEDQLSNSGKTYWTLNATIKQELGLWGFDQGTINTVAWTTPTITPAKSGSRADMQQSLCNLYISSNGHVVPTSVNKYVIIWISASPGEDPIGGPGDYRVLSGEKIKGRSTNIIWTHDPRFFDGSHPEWSEETDTGSSSGPGILNGGSTYGLKFLNMCVVDGTALKGWNATFNNVDGGDDGFRLTHAPGTGGFLAEVRRETSYWETFSNFNGGLTLSLKAPEGFTRIFKDYGVVYPGSPSGGLGTSVPDGFKSNSNMIPFIGDTWNGVLPSHVKYGPHGGGKWGGSGTWQNTPTGEFYPNEIGPADDSPIGSGARNWPMPTDGKVWTYKYTVTNEKFKPRQDFGRSFTPAGGPVPAIMTELGLVIVTWLSATPGGAPIKNAAGVPQVMTTSGAVETAYDVRWVVDLNESSVYTSAQQQQGVVPVMDKVWFLNDACIPATVAQNIVTRSGNTYNANPRQPDANELRAWGPNMSSYYSDSFPAMGPFMAAVSYGSHITSHYRYINGLAYENATDPSYEPPAGQWEGKSPVMDPTITYEGNRGSVPGYGSVNDLDWDQIATGVVYETQYPLLRDNYVPDGTQNPIVTYGIGSNGSNLSAYPALPAQYVKTSNDYAGDDATYEASIIIDHQTEIDNITEYDVIGDANGQNKFGANFASTPGTPYAMSPGTVNSIPFTVPDIITPTGHDVYDKFSIGMEVTLGQMVYNSSGEIATGVLLWWSSYAGGDPLGEAIIVRGDTDSSTLGTFSSEQWAVRASIALAPAQRMSGNLGNTYGVKWLNVAPVKETLTESLVAQANFIGSTAFMSHLEDSQVDAGWLSARWIAPQIRVTRPSPGAGTSLPIQYIVRGKPEDGSGMVVLNDSPVNYASGLGKDKLIGGSSITNTGSGVVTAPQGQITAIPFTTPTVNAKVDFEENLKLYGKGQLNGSGYDGETPQVASPGSRTFAYQGSLITSTVTNLTNFSSYTGVGTVWMCVWVSEIPGGVAINDKVFINEFDRVSSSGLNVTLSGDSNIFNGSYERKASDPNYSGPNIPNDLKDTFLDVGSVHGIRYVNMCLVDPSLFFTSGWDSNNPTARGTTFVKPGTPGFDSAVHGTHGFTTSSVTLDMAYPPSYVVKTGGEPMTGGGSGARLYFTSKNIPDCSNKSTAKESLGLPDLVDNADYVDALADMFNDGLLDAGYDPDDINFGTDVINDDISVLALDSTGYDGVEFGELTPGFLEKLGIPIGDYNHAMACMIMNNSTGTPDENITVDDINNLTTEDGFVIPSDVALPEEILTIVCVTDLEQPGRTIFGDGGPGTPGYDDQYVVDPKLDEGPDGGGVGGGVGDAAGGKLGHRGSVNASFIDNLYQYELATPTGGVVSNFQEVQNCDVLYLESQRFSSIEDLELSTPLKTEANVSTDITTYGKVWIDSTANVNLNLADATQGVKSDFISNSWSYYEDGIAKRWSQPLVDPTYIRNVLFYDNETGQREYDLDLWDPFKGVIPAFIDAEVHYVSKQDPVVYNSRRAKFGDDQCGQVWWDTSGVRYNWYEQGTNKERAANWGDVFPGSVINLYEWTQSLEAPLQYTGTGTPKNASEYLTDRRKDPTSGEYVNYYYFWVLNKADLTTHAKVRHMRKFTTVDLAKYLANPMGQGINTISFLSSNDQFKANQSSMLISNLENIIREDEQILQINLSRNLNPLGLKHVAWKLLRENDIDSNIPEDLTAKLIDSLCEQDATGQKVPADNLSEVEKYGTAFRPRQTMFKDPAEARREMHYALNEILANIKIETLKPKWAQTLPSQDIALTSNWYEVERTSSTNEKIRYDSTYKALFTVSSVKELDTLTQSKLSDGTIVMVRNSKRDRYQLWRWHGKDSEFKLIAIQNETAQLSDRVFKSDLTVANKLELRDFLYICKNRLFEGTNLWNKFFFSMLKFAYGEQLQLDWAFKSSYIYVDKEESDLTERVGFKPDNFESVKEYMDEAKPYTAKIREYKDGKKTPIDYISNQMVSDFDIPPYPDPVQGKVRVLDISSSNDTDILTENGDYVKWYSQVQEHSNIANAIVNTSPVRTGNIKMVFDRTDWRLLPHNYDASNLSYAQGTAEMISYLTSASNAQVSVNSNVSMSGRIFKFNDAVRAQFDLDVANAGITDVTDKTQLENAYVSGQLVGTLALVKDKVGGGFRGDELDANVFTKVVPGEDPLELQTGFGFDTDPFDAVGFDAKIEVQNFEGILNGNTTFRRDGVTYEGFDSVTFQKVLYGEERPEEMAMFSPLENMIINVRTSVFAYGNGQNENPTDAVALGPYPTTVASSASGTATVTTTYGLLLANSDVVTLAGGSFADNSQYDISNVSQNYDGGVYSNTTFTVNLVGYTADNTANITFKRGGDAVDVEYQVHYDMFGGEEWLRKLTDGSTSTVLAKDFQVWDDSFTVEDADKIQEPKPGVPGTLWINNSERIVYRSLDKATGVVADITRGTRGTTIASYTAGVGIDTGNYTEIFDDNRNADFQKRDPDSAYWLRSDRTSLSLTDITNRSTGNVQIAKFLQGDDSVSIGWDARGWEIGAWDGG